MKRALVVACAASIALCGCVSLSFAPQYVTVRPQSDCNNDIAGCTVKVIPVLKGEECSVVADPDTLNVYVKGADITWDMDDVYWIGGWVFERSKGVDFKKPDPQFKDKGRKWTGGKYTWSDDNTTYGKYDYKLTVHNALTRQRCSVDPTIVNQGHS